MPRRFDIHKAISLGFFNGREQHEQIVEPGQGHLEFDGHDIYWVSGDRRLMSDTINEAILIWLRSGDIVERD
ncbi:hypothetical protein ACTJKJ_23545 [Roseateles sp. 22389]|uniref:hypothetical protein n=1 Tax=Roseateles sp. 22389 TaxID=3453916 RepID=UPI003F864A87